MSFFERSTGISKHYNKMLDREDLYNEQFEAAAGGEASAAGV